jgi:hypothetical protein
MLLRALNGRKAARLVSTLATATRLTGTERSMPLKVPEAITPNGITFPSRWLTRSRPRVPT